MNCILGDEMGLGKTLQVQWSLRLHHTAAHDEFYHRHYLSLPMSKNIHTVRLVSVSSDVFKLII